MNLESLKRRIDFIEKKPWSYFLFWLFNAFEFVVFQKNKIKNDVEKENVERFTCCRLLLMVRYDMHTHGVGIKTITLDLRVCLMIVKHVDKLPCKVRPILFKLSIDARLAAMRGAFRVKLTMNIS